MFDIGAGEFIVIALVALLIVGPERLPALARQWVQTLRAVRQQAATARADLQASVGADVAEVTDLLRQADPRRLFTDESAQRQQPERSTAKPARNEPLAPAWDPDTP
ncbi:MAG: Sec-independent protein translocase protein TatB [Actinomycetales bacterium]|nr:Sec-independent protein translocase protein TatB [Actinomycetales bacterium]